MKELEISETSLISLIKKYIFVPKEDIYTEFLNENTENSLKNELLWEELVMELLKHSKKMKQKYEHEINKLYQEIELLKKELVSLKSREIQYKIISNEEGLKEFYDEEIKKYEKKVFFMKKKDYDLKS